MEILIKLLAAGGIMGVLDAIWLKIGAKYVYRPEIGQLLLDKPNMGAAILFYVIYLVGVIVFVINPALEKDSWTHALVYGAFFGFVAYATYDLTNLATIKGFSVKVVAIDLLWGTLLTATVAVGSFWIVKMLY